MPEPVRIKIEPDDIKEPEPNKFKEKLKNPEISIEKGADGVTISIKDGEDKKSTIKLKTGDADVQLTSKDFIWSEPKKRPNLNAKGQFPGGKYQLGTKHGGDKDVPLFIFCDPDKDECKITLSPKKPDVALPQIKITTNHETQTALLKALFGVIAF
jgi:hypothetical protein